MPTGFQSFNDWGTVQIDENYSAICFRQAPTIFVGSNPFGSPSYFDVSGISPMLFLGNTSGVAVVVLSRVSIGTNLWRFALKASSDVNVKVYIFDQGPPAAGNNGMQVFNASGVLTYDSSSPVLNMKAVYQTSGADVIGVPQDGRAYAAVLTFSRIWVIKQPVSHSNWPVYQEGLVVSPSSLTVSEVHTGKIGGEDPAAGRKKSGGAPQLILVDVTYL